MKAIKLALEFDGELRLPFAHFEILQGLVYKLMASNAELADEIHNMKGSDKKPFKFFCFTDVKGKYKIKDKTLIYHKRLSWEIRSCDDRIIDAVRASLDNMNEISVNNQKCRLISYKESFHTYKMGTVTVKMDTPMLHYITDRETGHTKYYNPLDREFLTGIVTNIKRKYKSFYGKEPDCGIRIEIVKVSEKDKCVTRYKENMITGYYGIYKITASPEIMNFIYYTGLGAKNSMGFGAIKEDIYD